MPKGTRSLEFPARYVIKPAELTDADFINTNAQYLTKKDAIIRAMITRMGRNHSTIGANHQGKLLQLAATLRRRIEARIRASGKKE